MRFFAKLIGKFLLLHPMAMTWPMSIYQRSANRQDTSIRAEE